VELTALSPRSGRAIATYFNFYVSRGNAVRFFRSGENIIRILQLMLLPTIKDF